MPLFSDGEAARLYDRPGEVDDIGVLAAPGTDPAKLANAIEDVVADDGARVLHGDDQLNASVHKVRPASAVIPIMPATGLATALIYLQTSQDDAGDRMFADGLKADAVVGSRSGALPPSLVDTLARLPQVAGASASVSGEARLETVLGPEGGGAEGGG